MNPRTCVGCRQTDRADRLWRGVLAASGHLLMQGRPSRKKLDGRGAYVHPREKCLIAALQRGGFDRSFRRKVIAPKIDTLLNMMSAQGRSASQEDQDYDS